MKNIILSILVLLSFLSCTGLKRAQTGIARTLVGEGRITVDGHEVYCSKGPVCSEIDVLAIHVEDRDGGKVRITFKNRTGNNALFQVRLEVISVNGELLAETRPENFAIPGTQEKNYEMPGVYRKGGRLRVLLSTAY